MKLHEVASGFWKIYNNSEVIILKNKRGLKNRTTISSTIKIELSEKLKELSEETKVPISKLLDEAIEYLLKERES